MKIYDNIRTKRDEPINCSLLKTQRKVKRKNIEVGRKKVLKNYKKTNLKIIWPNNVETIAFEGEEGFSHAKRVGLEIPTGCLTGFCGACEIDINGVTIRPCITNVKNDCSNFLKIEMTSDPYW